MSGPPQLEIRDFRPGDEDVFRRLNEEWITRYFELEPKDLKLFEDPEGCILDPGGAILILEWGGTPVGCCALIPHENGRVELGKMAITQAEQGKGYGDRLLRAAIVRAQDLGAASIYLETNSKLTPAIRLYQKLGFVEIPLSGAGPCDYSRVDMVMELPLAQPSVVATGKLCDSM